ncbi:hypothetical protein Daesc_005641 [Daldinia eschscholtzii]|uniref:Uncharacterized protein n=1 Tax=Daldinia eschscholtzii TaxID=292717 RepID=A0AAX6ML15_9PEZI
MAGRVSIPYFEIEYARDIDKVLRQLSLIERNVYQRTISTITGPDDEEELKDDIRDAQVTTAQLRGIKVEFENDPVALGKLETAIGMLVRIENRLKRLQEQVS